MLFQLDSFEDRDTYGYCSHKLALFIKDIEPCVSCISHLLQIILFVNVPIGKSSMWKSCGLMRFLFFRGVAI